MYEIKKPVELGDLTGGVLVGITSKGRTTDVDGEWLFIDVKHGVVVEYDGVDPEDYRPRVDPIADAAGDTRPGYDIKITIAEKNFSNIHGDLVRAFSDGKINVSGDEAFFIRYTPSVLALSAALRVTA